MKRYGPLSIVLILCLLAVGCQAAPSPTKAPTATPLTAPTTETVTSATELPYVEHQVILLFFYNYEGSGFSRDNAMAVINEEGLQILDEFEMPGPYPDEEGNTVADSAAAFLTQADGEVEEVVNRINSTYSETQVNAGPNFYLELERQPFDPEYNAGTQWGLNNTGQNIQGVNCKFDVDIDAPPMWTIRRSNTGAPLAIVDTGVGKIVAGKNIPDDLSPPFPAPDTDGHGTAVAGVAGAFTDNELDVAGVVWNATRLDYIHGNAVYGFAKSFFRATNDRAKVINLSASTRLTSKVTWREHLALFMSLFYADRFDVLVVVTAGNEGIDIDLAGNQKYPASYNAGFTALKFRPLENLLVVTATDCNGNNPSAIKWNPGGVRGPNWGNNTVDLEAPGKAIKVLQLVGAPAFKSGTSYAAPHVSGVAALIRAEDPTLRDDQVKQLILDTVDIMGRIPLETRSDGMLNGFRALYRAAGFLALQKYAALVEYFLDELLKALDNLNKSNNNLQDVLEDAPFGPDFTPDLQRSAIAELESLLGRQDISEEDVPYALAALRALQADVEQIPSISSGQQLSSAINIPGKVDTYSFYGVEGDVIVIDVDAQAMEYGWDSVLRLYDMNGDKLFTNDDIDGRDPRLSARLPYTGQYFFSVEELNRDDGDPNYMYYVDLLPGIFPTTLISPSYQTAWSGRIGFLGKVDSFQFYGSAGDVLIVNVDARINGSALDSEIFLYAPNGTLIASNDDADGVDSWLEAILTVTGQYSIAIIEHGNDAFGDNYNYDLSIWIYQQ